jgi:glycosyltransferase involved in cell wall biosynthesis
MRICHVSPHLPPDQAANALLPAELGAWLRAAGHDVSFVTQAPSQGKTADDAMLPGPVVRVAARGTPSALARVTRLHSLRRAREITEALDRAAGTAELLHLHSNGLIIEVAAAWAERRRLPYVLPLYGTEIWHYKRRKIFDPFTRAYRGAREVTFYSQRLLDKARELGLSRDHLSVVYPAVSAAFAPADAPTRARWRADFGITEPLIVLNVKRLHELAGQKFLIDAFARFARTRRDVRLVICGTGPLRAALEQQARDLGIADRITFAGLVPNADVARYAAIADVFALPSLLEALPTVAVEALSAGTPVVSADHPGGVELHEIFGDDVLVVARGQVDPLAAALADSLATPARTQPDTAVRLRTLFSPEAVRRQYEAVYERALKRTIS